jgi:hypothetical protein
MTRARNAVIIIVLCIIGATLGRKRPQVVAVHAVETDLRDAVADSPSARRGRIRRPLEGRDGDELRDSVAGSPSDVPLVPGATSYVAPIPRGSGEGGIKPLPYDPGQDFSEHRVLSPSGPDLR